MEWENKRKGGDRALLRQPTQAFYSSDGSPFSIDPIALPSQFLHWDWVCFFGWPPRCHVTSTLSSRWCIQCFSKTLTPQSSCHHSPCSLCQQRSVLWPSATALVEAHQLVHRISLPEPWFWSNWSLYVCFSPSLRKCFPCAFQSVHLNMDPRCFQLLTLFNVFLTLFHCCPIPI